MEKKYGKFSWDFPISGTQNLKDKNQLTFLKKIKPRFKIFRNSKFFLNILKFFKTQLLNH